MAIKIGQQLDLTQAPLLGLVFEPSDTPPLDPVDGQAWHDTAGGLLKVHLRGDWHILADDEDLATKAPLSHSHLAAEVTDLQSVVVAPLQASLTSHAADTTGIHGIADTALLETQSGAQTKANASRDAILAMRGSASGFASLTVDGHVPTAQIPAIAIVSTTPVSSEEQMLALAVEQGDVAVRADISRTFIFAGGDSTDLNDWVLLPTPTDAVISVDGRAGVVSLADLYDALGAAAASRAAHEAASDPHPQYETSTEVTAKVAAHEADTTSVHGIADTSILETQSGAQAKADGVRTTLLGGASSTYDTLKKIADVLVTKAAVADLAPVATAGTYTSLTGKPVIPAAAGDSLALPVRPTIDFVGPGIHAADDPAGARTVITVAGPPVRAASSITTTSLAANASYTGAIPLAIGYRLYSIQTDRPARVRLYGTTAQRDADLARAVGTDPAANSGLMLDFVTTPTMLSAALSPLVDGANLATTPSTSIPITVQNLDTATGTVTVTLTYIKTE